MQLREGFIMLRGLLEASTATEAGYKPFEVKCEATDEPPLDSTAGGADPCLNGVSSCFCPYTIG
jgi:hypothetical protein